MRRLAALVCFAVLGATVVASLPRPVPGRRLRLASWLVEPWRGKRTGPKVITVPLEGGVPTGEYEDFMTGFVVDDDAVWAHPVRIAAAHDGALFVSEDGNGTIWRIAFAGDE